MKLKFTLKLALCIILIVWLIPTMAKTYRWVDENGVTIYSQTPPPSGKATIIKPPPKPAASPDEIMENLKKRQAQIDEAKKAKQASAEEKDLLAKNAETMKKNCETTKNNIKMIKDRPRARIKLEDGSVKTLSDEERTAMIEQYNEDLKKWCK